MIDRINQVVSEGEKLHRLMMWANWLRIAAINLMMRTEPCACADA
jgi:hypothetical protein